MHLCVLSFNPNTKYHLIIRPFFIWQLKFILLPAKYHLGKPNYFVKNLYFYHISISIFKAQWFAVEILVMIWITPPVCIHQIGSMSNIFIVVKFVLVFFYSISEHDSKKHPCPDVKSIQLHKYFSCSLSYVSKTWPIHLLITSFNYSIGNSINVLTMIYSKYILSFDLSGLAYSFFSLLVVFFCYNFKFFISLYEHLILGLELIRGSI